jgi:hypothetical protein
MMAQIWRRLSACLGQGLERKGFPQTAGERVSCRNVARVLFYIRYVIYG